MRECDKCMEKAWYYGNSEILCRDHFTERLFEKLQAENKILIAALKDIHQMRANQYDAYHVAREALNKIDITSNYKNLQQYK